MKKKTVHACDITVHACDITVHACDIIVLVETLRALYMADNDFETLPAELGQLKNLQIVSWIISNGNTLPIV